MKTTHLKYSFFFKPQIISKTIAWHNPSRYLRNLRSITCVAFLVLMMFACGQEESGTSGYQADLVFPEDIQRIAETSKIDCLAAGIATIDFNFIAKGVQHGPHTFACEEHNAYITDVPAGTGITVEVFADDGNGDAVFEGSEVIDIPKNKVAKGGTIQMQHVSFPPAPDTDIANFDGTWIIQDYPHQDACIYAGNVEYISVIDQTGEHATITTTVPSIWPNTTIFANDCTVSGNELSCSPFPFEDDTGRQHYYSKFILRYGSYNDTLTGNNEWTIYGTSLGRCYGTSDITGTRAERDGGTEE